MMLEKAAHHHRRAADHPPEAAKHRGAGNREKAAPQAQFAPAHHLPAGDPAEDANKPLPAARNNRMRSIAVARHPRVMGAGATFNHRFRSEAR